MSFTLLRCRRVYHKVGLFLESNLLKDRHVVPIFGIPRDDEQESLGLGKNSFFYHR